MTAKVLNIIPPENRSALAVAQRWLAKTKKIVLKPQADEAAAHVVTLRRAMGEIKEEETAEKKPHRDAIREIGESYQLRYEPLQQTIDAIKALLTAYQERLRAELLRTQPRPERVTARVGRIGFAVTLRSFWIAKITDFNKALTAAREEPEIIEALQTVADRYARSSKGKRPLPGTKAVEERRSV